jgi:hypothetical protein
MTGLFKKDNYLLGSMIGILLPLISAVIIFIVLQLLGNLDINQNIKIYLLSIVLNILLIRYYFINLKFEKTAKALIFVTFIVLIAFFIYYFKR